jgi:hypothetical protein
VTKNVFDKVIVHGSALYTSHSRIFRNVRNTVSCNRRVQLSEIHYSSSQCHVRFASTSHLQREFTPLLSLDFQMSFFQYN